MHTDTATESLPTAETPLIDVRRVLHSQRHPLIFSTFDALAPGEALELVNDHDPVPLYFQFERTRLGLFDWRYLQAGPALWRVRIARVAPGAASGEAGGCCGSCSCR